MNLLQILDQLKADNYIKDCISHWEVIPPREAIFVQFPEEIETRIKSVLEKRGIKKLYSHQATALENISFGKNVVIVTPTASGKTLCYNLPVVNKILASHVHLSVNCNPEFWVLRFEFFSLNFYLFFTLL
ncbi:MAG: DEAD/DEAH box helicase [Candidatus Zixiibacteriota bacterium]